MRWQPVPGRGDIFRIPPGVDYDRGTRLQVQGLEEDNAAIWVLKDALQRWSQRAQQAKMQDEQMRLEWLSQQPGPHRHEMRGSRMGPPSPAGQGLLNLLEKQKHWKKAPPPSIMVAQEGPLIPMPRIPPMPGRVPKPRRG